MKFNGYQNSHITSCLWFTIGLQNIGMCKQTTKNNLEKAPSPVNITSITSVSFRIHFASHARHPLNHFVNFDGLRTNFFFFSSYRQRKLILSCRSTLTTYIFYLPSEFPLCFSLARVPHSHARYLLARAINLSDCMDNRKTGSLSIINSDCWRFILITDFVWLTYSRIWRCY